MLLLPTEMIAKTMIKLEITVHSGAPRCAPFIKTESLPQWPLLHFLSLSPAFSVSLHYDCQIKQKCRNITLKIIQILNFSGSIKLVQWVRKNRLSLKPSLNLCPQCPPSLTLQGVDQRGNKQAKTHPSLTITCWWANRQITDRMGKNDWNRNCHTACEEMEKEI